MTAEWIVKSRRTGRVLIGFAERDAATAHAEKINTEYQTDDYVVEKWRDQ